MSWRELLRALACIGLVLLAYVDAQRVDDEHHCQLERLSMNDIARASSNQGPTPQPGSAKWTR